MKVDSKCQITANRQLNSVLHLNGEKTFATVNPLVTMQLLSVCAHQVQPH